MRDQQSTTWFLLANIVICGRVADDWHLPYITWREASHPPTTTARNPELSSVRETSPPQHPRYYTRNKQATVTCSCSAPPHTRADWVPIIDRSSETDSPVAHSITSDMAFTIKIKAASLTSNSTFPPAVHQPSSLITTRAASVAKMPAGRRKAAAIIRAVAAVAPRPAPTPAKPAGKRCLSVSQTMSRIKAQGKVYMCFHSYRT